MMNPLVCSLGLDKAPMCKDRMEQNRGMVTEGGSGGNEFEVIYDQYTYIYI